MSVAVTRGKGFGGPSVRRVLPSGGAFGGKLANSPEESEALDALGAQMAASRARRAVQNRIAQAYRRQLEGAGEGPSNVELWLFVRLAIAEQRRTKRCKELLRRGDRA